MSEKQPASVPRAAKRIGVGARGATVVTTQDERRRADGLGHAGRRAALGRRAAEHELQAGAMHELTHDRPPRPEGAVAVRSREEDRPRRSEERRAALCREWCQRWHAAATRRWWRMAYTFDGGRVVTVRPAPTPVPELSAWDETGREGKFSSALGRLCLAPGVSSLGDACYVDRVGHYGPTGHGGSVVRLIGGADNYGEAFVAPGPSRGQVSYSSSPTALRASRGSVKTSMSWTSSSRTVKIKAAFCWTRALLARPQPPMV